jgi:hypothetical protein
MPNSTIRAPRNIISTSAQRPYIPLPQSSHYVGGMKREDVSREQAEAIKEKIGPMFGYLNRLKKRMNKAFARDDSLFAEVIDAADALHKLNVSIHYLSCGKKGAGSGGYPAPIGFTDSPRVESPQADDQPQHHGYQGRGD